MFDVSGATDNLLISLEQNDTKGRESGSKNLCIGFHIMKVRRIGTTCAGTKLCNKTSLSLFVARILDLVSVVLYHLKFFNYWHLYIFIYNTLLYSM